MKAISAIIIWKLWKIRNARRHNKDISFNKMYYQYQLTVHQLIRNNFPWLKGVLYHWNCMFDLLQEYSSKIYFKIVRWILPEVGWIKCNTDEASKGNSGISSYEFCLRDETGDILYAKAKNIRVTTNMKAELIAVEEALRYCRAQGINHIMLETDSLSLGNMITKD